MDFLIIKKNKLASFLKKSLMLKKIAPFIFFLILISCEKDDNSIEQIEKKVEIVSFSIEDNTVNGVKTKAQLSIEGYNNIFFENHGVFIIHDDLVVKKIEQGKLTTNNFEALIRSGIVKGKTYTVFPYVHAENKMVYGDTLDFTSNVDIKINFKELKPLKGFVYDTISIIGENFCKSLPDSPTRILLNNNFQDVIFESDSLIKVIVTPNINSSKLTPMVRNCGVDTIIPKIFKINPPILDSISSFETYVGENSFIYGKNFHSQISNVWINDVEAHLNKQRLDIDKLEMTIPEGLPPGLLNLKIKVLDTIIEKQDYYKSTSPIITSLDKRDTGFLDTLTIKGNYLKQKNLPTKVFVGGKQQQIINLTKEEVKVIINNFYSDTYTSPKLVLKTGSFELEENINMLPPEIISVDKDKYHLDDDFVTLKTKYFIAGSSYNINIGGVTLRNYNSFIDVDEYGNITLPMKSWIEADQLYPKYVFNDIGKLNIEIKTQYGTSEKNINIFPPKIESIANSSLFINTDYIELSGLDFGYNRVSKIYIDDELVQNPGTSAYTLYNKEIKFQVPKNITPGGHKLKVQTGGQFSNEITFNAKEITTSGLTNNSGIRELDIFTINGNNLENKYSYVIKVNGVRCNIINTSHTQVQFTLPYHTALETGMSVTLEYGSEIIDVGIINGIEPYSKLDNYQVPNEYYNNSSYFEYKGELYFLNLNGIYRFDETSYSWVNYESDIPFTSYSDSNGRNYISEVGDRIYIPYGNSFYAYNMVEKNWDNQLNLSSNENFMLYGIIDGDYAYVFEGPDAFNLTFNKYNLANNHIKETVNQPLYSINGSGLGTELYYHSGKIYLDVRDQNIIVYNISTDTWEDIDFPREYKYFYDNNLYVHNDALYFSGGQGNSGLEFNLYSYDLNTKVWKEKTPTLLKLGKHAVWGSGDFLYFGLGNQTYTSSNNYEMLKYDIKSDPR